MNGEGTIRSAEEPKMSKRCLFKVSRDVPKCLLDRNNFDAIFASCEPPSRPHDGVACTGLAYE